MNIREIHKNKKQFLPLLLLADEQEDMIDRYLERGAMYVLEDGGVKASSPMRAAGFLSSRTLLWSRKRRERATVRH